MRFTTVSTIALGFAGLTVSQFETTITSVSCINPRSCTNLPPTRSNSFATPTINSSVHVGAAIEQRGELFSSKACTTITSKKYDYPIPFSTHIECRNRHVQHPCSTSYECGCHSTARSWPANPGSHFCFPVPTSTSAYATPSPQIITEYRRVATEAETTAAAKPCDTGYFGPRCKACEAVAPRYEPNKFDPGCFPIITHPAVHAIEARETVAPRCEPGKFGPGCFPIITHPVGNAIKARQTAFWLPGQTGADCHTCISGRNEPGCPPSPGPPASAAITLAAALDAPQEPTHTMTGSSHFGCPKGTCGPGCRWGHECDKKFGRGATQNFGGRSQRGVKRDAEATNGVEVVHSTLLTLRA
ncbi:hypothetical protein G6011_00128 [Alternaria panax]|uniref:Uncharacterized protein n=1 Tax=Alternaria panax TaxID=48097 RepID=A0AAD4NUQ3_9PLEO|nr:hypothetical protein G6011_00128 [Alternaria panax]